MEQDSSEGGAVDLREAFNDIDLHVQNRENDGYAVKKVPTLYGLLIKISRGKIKNEEQAKKVFIFIILITNLFTFYLIYQQFGGGGDIIPAEDIPAEISNP